MADAVEALGQIVQQEATDEFVSAERHHLLPGAAVAAVIFEAEGDACVVEAEEPAVRDGDPVGVARQIVDSDEAAPSFREDRAPLFRDNVAPSEMGRLTGTDGCCFVRVRREAAGSDFNRRMLSPSMSNL